MRVDLLPMDDREGVMVARRRDLAVTGTIGVLDMAAKRSLIDLADAFARLRQTNFHCPEAVMAKLVAEERRKDQ